MKILSKEPGYAHNLFWVALSETEHKLADKEIVNLVDNDGKCHQTCNHFGGTVKRNEDGTAIVKVYTD